MDRVGAGIDPGEVAIVMNRDGDRNSAAGGELQRGGRFKANLIPCFVVFAAQAQIPNGAAGGVDQGSKQDDAGKTTPEVSHLLRSQRLPLPQAASQQQTNRQQRDESSTAVGKKAGFQIKQRRQP